jgi:hypothetical protein
VSSGRPPVSADAPAFAEESALFDEPVPAVASVEPGVDGSVLVEPLVPEPLLSVVVARPSESTFVESALLESSPMSLPVSGVVRPVVKAPAEPAVVELAPDTSLEPVDVEASVDPPASLVAAEAGASALVPELVEAPSAAPPAVELAAVGLEPLSTFADPDAPVRLGAGGGAVPVSSVPALVPAVVGAVPAPTSPVEVLALDPLVVALSLELSADVPLVGDGAVESVLLGPLALELGVAAAELEPSLVLRPELAPVTVAPLLFGDVSPVDPVLLDVPSDPEVVEPLAGSLVELLPLEAPPVPMVLHG